MVNIFFIHRFPFNKEAFIRDEFEYFISQGFNVKYLDISHLLKKKKLETTCTESLKRHVITFLKQKDFNEFLMDNKVNSLVVTDIGLLSNSAWMFLAIFKSGIEYVLFENTVLPKIKIKKAIGSNKVIFLKIFKRFNYKKLYKKPIEIFNYYRAIIALKPAKMIITSKQKLRAKKRILIGVSTVMKYSMSIDYKVAQDVKSESIVNEPYAVFVDQYFIHHPDFKTNHIVHSFTANEYYVELNKFLVNFSQQTGLKVVIAAHPRRSEEKKKDFNSSFDLYYNKTADLIKNSKIVLVHFSTAINFAVIFNKPFVLLNSSLFKNSSVYEHLMMLSIFFGKEPVVMGSINSELPLKELLFINENKYQEYLDLYIKHPRANNETFKDMILENIKSL